MLYGKNPKPWRSPVKKARNPFLAGIWIYAYKNILP